MSEKKDLRHFRRPRNFHESFVPERQYLNALLKYADQEKSGDIQAISKETGIPTGEYSGKVGPTIDYCRGMGLILLDSKSSSIKTPQLTELGRSVLLNDPFFLEPLTQWIGHFHLCNPWHGADVWYQTFCLGADRLGIKFTRDELNDWLQTQNLVKRGNVIGPMVRMYEDSASFGACGVLSEEAGVITKKNAPIDDLFAIAYGAWMISLMENLNIFGVQISLTELNSETFWQTTAGWNQEEAAKVLQFVEQTGLISVDRHMSPWLIKAFKKSEDIWKSIYDELI